MRTPLRRSLAPCLAAARLEERGRACAAVQHRRLGLAARARPSFRPTSSGSGRRSASRRCRAAARPAWQWRRPTPPSRSNSRRSARSRRSPPKPTRADRRRCTAGPLRIRGRVGDGLYWSLRAAGASPQVAAQYLAALATEIDVGEVGAERRLRPGARAQPRIALRRPRPRRAIRTCSWSDGTPNGRSEWIDAANAERPAPVESGMMMPVDGPHHFLFRQSLSPDPALHPLPCRDRYRRGLGQPDRRRRRRPGRRRRLGRRLWPRGPDRPRRRARQPLRPHERDRRRSPAASSARAS